MEACTSVEREVDRVISKFSTYSDHTTVTLRNLHNDIESLQKEINQVGDGDLNESQVVILSQALGRARDVITKLSSDHRDLHSCVSKVGKTIDKNFTSDFACVSNETFLTGEKKDIINEVICQHLFREGHLDVAETLIKESHVDLPDSSRIPYFELNRIVASLKERKLEPALAWVDKNRDKLRAQKSTLEFKLHRLAYIGLLSEGPHKVKEAIEYAKTYLTPFVNQHEKAIQTLLGSLLYLQQGWEHSPYPDLLGPDHWEEICEIFAKDACALMGLSVDSPLAVCVSAGCTALPILLNIKQVMQQQQVQNMWNTKDELPIEIDLGSDCRYHSIFACPILRQQATEVNPPMRLTCGHVISRDALTKLTNGNKMKCPYCPVEQTPSDAVPIYF